MIRMFSYKKLRYVWDDEKRQFLRLNGLDALVDASCFHAQVGLSAYQQLLRFASTST